MLSNVSTCQIDAQIVEDTMKLHRTLKICECFRSRRILSLREIARLWDEFKCPSINILDTVPAYVTVNNCDLIISNNVIISKNTGLFERKYVAYRVSHDDRCLQVCGVPQIYRRFRQTG